MAAKQRNDPVNLEKVVCARCYKVALNVTKKDRFEDLYRKKKFAIQEFNPQHQFAGEQSLRRKIGNVKGTKFSAKTPSNDHKSRNWRYNLRLTVLHFFP